LLIVLVLIALPLATFARVLGHGFVDWDDRTQLYENPDFNPPSPAKIARYWRGPHMNLYLPVTYTLWGGVSAVARDGPALDARYFHATNLLLHVASTLLVYAILRTLAIEHVPAAIGAAVFAVHPVMVEPVAWASATYTVLSGMFALLAVHQYLRFARADAASSGRSKWTPLAIGTVALLLAMLAKPSAVVVPIITCTLDVLLVRKSLRRALPATIAWLLVALPIMIVAKIFQPAAWVEHVPLWQRPIIAADAIAFYVVKVVLPLRLGVDYGRFPAYVMTRTAWFATWLVPAALAAIAWRWRRPAPWIAASLICFVAGMGTYLGLATFDFQYWSTVADRYLYLSMLGVALAIAYALTSIRRELRPVACGCAVVVIALLAVRSSLQTGVWRDTHTLFTHAVHVNPQSVIAHNSLGYLATRAGDANAAATHYRTVLKVKPRDGGANYNLANAHLAAGELDAAIAHYQVAVQSPPPNPLAFNNLGVALARAQQFDEAEQAFRAALRIEPTLEMARHGIALVQQRRDAAAATQPATQP
jgi:hypothetical protein